MTNQVETIIEYQLDNRDRKTVFWRGILVMPVAVFASAFTQMEHWGWTSGLVVVPTLLALVFRGVYPSYVLSFNHALMELQARISAYFFLLTDDYPSIERNPKVAILFPDVAGGAKLGRILQIFKIFFAIPLFIVGIFYSIAAFVVSIAAWVHTWSTGRYPQWAVHIVLGTIQYWNRVFGYALLYLTDEYPRFTL
jgi:TRAP-type mannitol/chloroaromatic compound transport system permease small subunit